VKSGHSRRSFLTRGTLAGAGLFAAHPLATFGQALETAVDNARLSSSPSALRITELKCGFLRGGSRLFVKIHTNQGIWGCGEAVDAVNGTYDLVKSLGQRLARRNPLDVHRLFEDLRRGGVFGGAQSGVYVAVLSAIETALWDLAGKALGVPVYRLLGGKFRDRIRVYMDTALYQSRLPSPADFAEAALEAKNMGMTGIKFDLDQAADPGKYDSYNWTASPAELRRMEGQIAAAREAVGPDIDICADMHGR
jgi:galactonate dehydratase